MVALERAVTREKLVQHQMEYSIKLADPREPDGMETRGLIVIKQTKKSQAMQRKQAVANWKVVGGSKSNFSFQIFLKLKSKGFRKFTSFFNF